MSWKVSDVMRSPVKTITEEVGYKEIVETLLVEGISGVCVIGPDGRLLGVVSEADLMLKEEYPDGGRNALWIEMLCDGSHNEKSAALIARLVKASASTAGELMTSPAITIESGADVCEAARLMEKRNLKRLPVVERSGELVGIVTRSDLLKVFLRCDETLEWDVQALVPPGVGVAALQGVVALNATSDSEPELDEAITRIYALPGVVSVRVNSPGHPAGWAGFDGHQ